MKAERYTIMGLQGVLRQANQRNYEQKGEIRFLLQHLRGVRDSIDKILQAYEGKKWAAQPKRSAPQVSKMRRHNS